MPNEKPYNSVFLFKPHTRENSPSQAVGQHVLTQLDCKIPWSSQESINIFVFLPGDIH